MNMMCGRCRVTKEQDLSGGTDVRGNSKGTPSQGQGSRRDRPLF